ncbi:methyltransferase [Thecamonas trahens ATCC 50062]|uniref:Methyltransferase n=1 Tax=Thecamonas trahens ATCC 50062 TaxID=461836 RepID=A0A0L0D8V2_THETB|nr:methyltransferase [Thecamonas trahens ATCC 50062]KNC48506.1 methyltransferase [Thecamonas trahens ATCC 50062]|eukprot:XP_013758616.1 methyltransferase [Thecamonas trahens ATCC 50062]
MQREIEWALSRAKAAFPAPKIVLEQYPTSAEIASHMVATMDEGYGDVEGAHVVDLGSGTGMLSLACALGGAESVTGVEIDDEARMAAEENLALLVDAGELDAPTGVTFVAGDVLALGETLTEGTPSETGLSPRCCRTVILNPPFGTKKHKGLDTKFLAVAFDLATSAVYSLHKSSTRRFLLKFAAKHGVDAHVLAELRYELPNTYKFHKKKSVDIEVDFIRFDVSARATAAAAAAVSDAEAAPASASSPPSPPPPTDTA